MRGIIVFSFLFWTVSASASLGPSVQGQVPGVCDGCGRPTVISSYVAMDGIYQVPKEIELKGRTRTGSEETIRFMENEAVALQFLPGDGVLIHFNITEEEAGYLPDHLLISREDFIKSGLKMAGVGSPEELRRGQFSDLGTQLAAKRMILRVNGRVIAQGCLAYVLKNLGLTHLGSIGGGKGMTRALKSKMGWRPVSCQNPPVGAVGSWTGGSHGSGHTAIWNGRAWCYDQGCKDPGRKYRLFECVSR